MKQTIEQHKKILAGIRLYIQAESDLISRYHYPSQNSERDAIKYRKQRLKDHRASYNEYKRQLEQAIAKGLSEFERKEG